MEQIAASKLPSRFRRHASYNRSLRSRSNEVPHEGGNGQLEPVDENTSLLRHPIRHFQSHPPQKDNRRWVRLPVQAAYSVGSATYKTLTRSWANVFLVFVPLGIIAGAIGWNPTAVFVLNFCAIIPLAGLLSFATEELSQKVGETLGGLLNATFGNAVELIVSIVALKQGQIRIVQSSMLGSILSNILLVLGCCFFAGGIKYHEQEFNSTVASTMSSLMAVSSASLIIPATLYAAMKASNTTDDKKHNILVLSHGTAVILLILYVLYLWFQLRTHSDFFDEENNTQNSNSKQAGQQTGQQTGHRIEQQAEQRIEQQAGQQTEQQVEQRPENDDSEQEEPILTPWAAGAALVVITIGVAVCAEYLVDSIDSIVKTANISKTFIGLILLPIVGNAAEHVTAVVVSLKDKMDLAIGVAIGSSMQIALLVTPFLVLLGWAIDEPMTLQFEVFETVVFFLSVLITNYLIADGKSNYLEGAMLLGMYIIIALAFYVYPDDAGACAMVLGMFSRSS